MSKLYFIYLFIFLFLFGCSSKKNSVGFDLISDKSPSSMIKIPSYPTKQNHSYKMDWQGGKATILYAGNYNSTSTTLALQFKNFSTDTIITSAVLKLYGITSMTPDTNNVCLYNAFKITSSWSESNFSNVH